jgi:iron complex outermembrane receptor protein
MPLKAICFSVTLLLLVNANGAMGLEKQKQVLLDGIVVTATKTETDVKEIPASVSVITQEEIKSMQVVRPEELLKGVEGVDGASPLAGGFPGNPRLRGLPPTFAGATTQFLVNGLPVEPVLISNRQAWLLIPPQAIERIEVVRGPVSALYGPSAAGGVINIITKQGNDTPFFDLSGGYGSHDSYRGTVSSGGALNKKFDYMIVGDYYKTEGYKPLPDAESTPFPWQSWYPQGYYDIEGRESEDKKLYTSFQFHPTDAVEISTGYSHVDSGGFFLGGHPNYDWGRRGNAVDVGYRQRFSEAFELKAKLLYASFKNWNNYDENSENGDGSLALHSTEFETETAWNGELQGDLHFADVNTLTLGVSHNLGEFESTIEDAAGETLGEYEVKSTVSALYLQDQHRFGDLVAATLGLRYDRYKFFDDVRSDTDYPDSDDDVPTFRTGVRINPSQSSSIYLSAGTAYLPALNNFKYRTGNRWLDNPDLKPEKSITYEVGLDQWIGSAVKTKLAMFSTQYENMISSVQSGTQWQYQNVSEVEVKGLEAGLEAVFSEHWLVSLNYTYTDSEITKNPSQPNTEGKRPSYTPEHKSNLAITYDNPRIILASIQGRYVGDRYYNNANTEEYKTDDFIVVDLKVSRTFAVGRTLKEMTLSFAVNNVFDEKYSEFWFENADGVNIWAEAALRF